MWNLWFRYAYVAFKYWGDVTTIHSDDIIRGSYGVIFFGPTVPIREGEISIHAIISKSVNNTAYYVYLRFFQININNVTYLSSELCQYGSFRSCVWLKFSIVTVVICRMSREKQVCSVHSRKICQIWVGVFSFQQCTSCNHKIFRIILFLIITLLKQRRAFPLFNEEYYWMTISFSSLFPYYSYVLHPVYVHFKQEHSMLTSVFGNI